MCIFPFLFEFPDWTDEDADEVDEEERISIGTAWCKDTILGLLVPPCTLLPPGLPSKADDELLFPPVK